MDVCANIQEHLFFFIDLEWSVFNLYNRARICIAMLNLFSGFANVLLKLFVLVHGFVLRVEKSTRMM